MENKVYTTSVIEIDEHLGFIIPPEILRNLNIKVGDEMSFELIDDYVVMKPIFNKEYDT